jgi:hypothetical protein
MRNKEDNSKSKSAIRVAIITGIFGLCTAILTVVVGPIVAPIVQDLLRPTPTQVVAALTPDRPKGYPNPPGQYASARHPYLQPHPHC